MGKKTGSREKAGTLLSVAMTNILDPLVKMLDYNVGKGEADAGMQTPSMRDIGLRIILGNFIQTLHNQTYGSVQSSNGTSYDNAQTRMEKSEKQVADIITNRRNEHKEEEAFVLSDLNLTPKELSALHWFDVNESRLAAYDQMLTAFKDVYVGLTGEDWKPYERKDNSADKAVAAAAERRKATIERVRAMGIKVDAA